jgi:D-serine deaminase-like pyridoxal phosphate-dependent protein
MASYSEWQRALEGRKLPAAIVDLDAFDRNLERVLEYVPEGMTLRIASKSIRVPELLRRALAHSPKFKGLMCFSVEEALELSRQGFSDLLIAYPVASQPSVDALKELHARDPEIRIVIDCEEHARLLNSAFSQAIRPLLVVIEMDCSVRVFGAHLGVRRSPIRSLRGFFEVFDLIERLEHVRFAGLMGYEAQIAGLGDRSRFKKWMNPLKRLVRAWSLWRVRRLRKQIAYTLREQGERDFLFNAGGSGSLNWTSQEPWITELTAGSAFFCGHLFDTYSNIEFEPALGFALEVSRASDPDYVTCLGGGVIASGEPGWDRVPLPVYPEGLELVQTEGCGEVQTPLHVRAGFTRPKLGSSVLFRPAKSGEPLERFSEVLVFQRGEITHSEKTYRHYGAF